jgi:hypothetical protein
MPPLKLPEWASSVLATTTEPPTQRKQLGHQFKLPPLFDEENYWKNLVYLWISAVKGAATFTDLETAVDALTDPITGPLEYTAIIDEYDCDNAPGSVHTDVDTGAEVVSVDVTAASVVYLENAAAAGFAVERADCTTAIATYTKTAGAGTNYRIISDGRYTALAYGTFVELFNHTTGVSQWSYDHGGIVYDIAMDGVRLYLVGESGTGTKHARGITLATGVAAWSYQHTGVALDELWSVATNGRQVFVAGNISGYASGANLRALEASTGNDAANEGGTAADTTGSAWDAATPGVVAANERLATDGRRLYCGFGAAGAVQLEIRGCADGVVVASRSLGALVQSVAVDQDMVVVSTGVIGATYPVFAFDKFTLAPLWRWYNTAAGVPNNRSVASDGCAVFVGSVSTGTRSLSRIYRGNRPGVWRRIDPDDSYLPMRQLLIPHQ